MALIRQAEAERIARSAIVLDLGDISRQGDRIRKKAEDDAHRIVESAKAERARLVDDAAEVGRKQGFQEGFEKGLAEGREKGLAEARQAATEKYESLCASWLEALQLFESTRDNSVAHARMDIIRFAVAFAERVSRRTIDLDDQVITAQLDAALALVTEATRLRIEVHPDDVTCSEEVLPNLMSKLSSTAHATVIGSPDLSRGSCRIRTDHGMIDATIETQIQRLIEAALPADGLRLTDRCSRDSETHSRDAKDAAA